MRSLKEQNRAFIKKMSEKVAARLLFHFCLRHFFLACIIGKRDFCVKSKTHGKNLDTDDTDRIAGRVFL